MSFMVKVAMLRREFGLQEAMAVAKAEPRIRLTCRQLASGSLTSDNSSLPYKLHVHVAGGAGSE